MDMGGTGGMRGVISATGMSATRYTGSIAMKRPMRTVIRVSVVITAAMVIIGIVVMVISAAMIVVVGVVPTTVIVPAATVVAHSYNSRAIVIRTIVAGTVT